MALGKSPPDISLSLNDIGNQTRLQKIALEAPARTEDKPLRALCTFHMNQKLVPDFSGIPDRQEAYDVLRPNPACHFVANRLKQDECWRIHREFAFEISPRGKGLDCFRTWEALFLNTIPVVKTTTLDPIYEDEAFPVVIVQSYRDVTRENLACWRAALQEKFTPKLTQRLTNDYWRAKILDVAFEARRQQ
jgi:hypothetical protein